MNVLVWGEHQGLHCTSSLLQGGVFPRLHATRDLPCSFPILAACKHLAEGLKGRPLCQMLSFQQNTKPLQSTSYAPMHAQSFFARFSVKFSLPESTTMLKASESLTLAAAG